MLLDRYVLRNLLEPFLLCFFGFLGIWLIFDLNDNGPDFIEAKAPLRAVAGFYVTQLPATVVICLPVGLLLGLLYSLSRMARRNEIISMLTAGRSITRMLLPLFGVGLVTSLACLALNYEAAPEAEGLQKAALAEISGKRSSGLDTIEGCLFRDRQNHRTWYIRKLRLKKKSLEDVNITQQDPEGHIVTKWYAKRARHDAETGAWKLEDGLQLDFDLQGDVIRTENFADSEKTVSSWPETPRRIASAQVEAQALSVPDLRDYLQSNADFPDTQLAPYRTYLHYRLALPWACLVVVFIASPLGIIFSRQGVLAGVASSIFIFLAMLVLTNFFLALGKGDRIAPWLAAWFPNLFFFTVGSVLLYCRSTNRDLLRVWRRRR